MSHTHSTGVKLNMRACFLAIAVPLLLVACGDEAGFDQVSSSYSTELERDVLPASQPCLEPDEYCEQFCAGNDPQQPKGCPQWTCDCEAECLPPQEYCELFCAGEDIEQPPWCPVPACNCPPPQCLPEEEYCEQLCAGEDPQQPEWCPEWDCDCVTLSSEP